MNIERLADGAIFEVPDETPLPEGYRPEGGFFHKLAQSMDPISVLGKVQQGLGKALAGPFQLAGKLDVATGMKTPEQAESRAQTYGNLVRDVGESALVPWGGLSFLGRLGAAGGVAGGQSLLENNDFPTAGKSALLGAGTQGLMEGITAPVKAIVNARAANKAEGLYNSKKSFDESLASSVNDLQAASHAEEVKGLRTSYADQLRTSRITYNRGKQATEGAYTQQVAAQDAKILAAQQAHAEATATSIADEFKAQIPAWQGFPSSTRGLLDMIYGKGQAQLSEVYDAAWRDAAQRASDLPNKLIIPAELAERLKVPIDGIVSDPSNVAVSAMDLLKSMQGKWKTAPGAYNQAGDILAEQGAAIDPAARAAYKAGQALIGYVDRTKALEGEVLHPDRLIGGLTDLKKLNILRNRGQGDIFEGPLQAARGGPIPPPEIPKPTIPAYEKPPAPTYPHAPTRISPLSPPAPDVQRVNLPPRLAREIALGGVGGLLGGGHGGALHGGIGGALGWGLGAMLPDKLVVKAPVDPDTLRRLLMTPSILATILRSTLQRQATEKP